MHPLLKKILDPPLRKIKKPHVAVVQQWLRNGQNSVIDMKRLLLCQSKLSCCCRSQLLLKLQYCCDPEILLPWVCEVTVLLSIKHIHRIINWLQLNNQFPGHGPFG